jgi:hypothetical protein
MATKLNTPRRLLRPALTRGVAAIGIAAAVLLLVGSIALFAFAQILPALVVLGATILLAAISLPALWSQIPEDRSRLERPMH